MIRLGFVGAEQRLGGQHLAVQLVSGDNELPFVLQSLLDGVLILYDVPDQPIADPIWSSILSRTSRLWIVRDFFQLIVHPMIRPLRGFLCYRLMGVLWREEFSVRQMPKPLFRSPPLFFQLLKEGGNFPIRGGFREDHQPTLSNVTIVRGDLLEIIAGSGAVGYVPYPYSTVNSAKRSLRGGLHLLLGPLGITFFYRLNRLRHATEPIDMLYSQKALIR